MSLTPIWPQVALDAVAQRDACIPESLRLPASFLAKYPPGSDVMSAAAESGLMTDKELEITDPSNDATAVRLILAILATYSVSLLDTCCYQG